MSLLKPNNRAKILLMLATELKVGKVFKENGQPFQVVRYELVKSARGAATVKVKAKNLITGSVLEKGCDSNGRVEDADVYRKNAQYLYKEGEKYIFMDPDTYDQFGISAEILGEGTRFLIEGESVQVLYFDSKPISVDLPISMVFEVAYTEPGFKGNTVSNVYKEAQLTNGANVKVPTFIKNGDRIKIDTRTGEYVSKA